MNFHLRYRGPLPAGSRYGTDSKHAVRLVFHRQLMNLCRRDPRFQSALDVDLPVGALRGRKVDVETHRPLSKLFFAVPLKGFHFVPLVTRAHELTCELEITMLRWEKAGSLVSGGDLDNRIKNLFDALRMPHDENELGTAAPEAEARCYCLLEDDSLVTRLCIATSESLEPMLDSEKKSDVDLSIKVTVQASYPMIGNLGFPVA
jgi:hypothetical protein